MTKSRKIMFAFYFAAYFSAVLIFYSSDIVRLFKEKQNLNYQNVDYIDIGAGSRGDYSAVCLRNFITI